MIIGAFLLFFSVAFQEYLEHAIAWPYWLSGIRVGVEEGSELLGLFLCLNALVLQREKNLSSNRLLPIILNPNRMHHLVILLLGGLVLHIGASLYALQLTDLGQRDNPAIFYPSALFCLLFAASVWKAQISTLSYAKIWHIAALEFIFMSAGIVFNPFRLFSNFHLIYFSQMLLILLLTWLTNKEKYRNYLIVFTSLAYILAISYHTQNPFIEFSFPGIFTFLSAVILCNVEDNAERTLTRGTINPLKSYVK